jgi:FkbM family methyltransferase
MVFFLRLARVLKNIHLHVSSINKLRVEARVEYLLYNCPSSIITIGGILHLALPSPKLVVGRMFSLMSRRSFVPMNMRRQFFSVSMRHFGFFPEQNLLPTLSLNSQDVFLDIGANWGVFTLFMAPKCNHVYAWEPSPKAFPQLDKNTKSWRNVTILNEALGEANATRRLYLHKYSGHDSLVTKASDFTGNTVRVKVRSLDDYDFGERIGLMKIDTEGYELPVLKGALRTIQKHEPRLIIEVHEPCMEQIANLLPSYKWSRCCQVTKFPMAVKVHLIGKPSI